MSILGDIGDPVKVAAALKPLVDSNVDKLIAALKDLPEGLTVTITVTKKPPFTAESGLFNK